MADPNAQETPVVDTQAILAFLTPFRAQLSPEDVTKTKDFTAPARIFLKGKNRWQSFYSDGDGTKPPKNALSQNQLKLVRQVANKGFQDPRLDEPAHESGGNVKIMIGDKPALVMTGGYVHYNALKDKERGLEQVDAEPQGTWVNPWVKDQQTKASVPATAAVIDPVTESTADIQDAAVQPAGPTLIKTQPTPPSPALAPKPMHIRTFHRYLDGLEQQVPEASGTAWHRDQMAQTYTQRKLYARQSAQNQRVIGVATDLITRFGAAEGQHLIYRTEQYTLQAQGNYLAIRDADKGTLLFEATKGISGRYKVQQNRLQATDKEVFDKAAHFLKNNAEAMTRDPRLRVQQLEQLAPRGDNRMAEDLITHSLSQVATRFLDLAKVEPNQNGEQVLKGKYYTIARKEKALTISAHGRGTILEVGPNKHMSKVTPRDLEYFRFMASRYLPGRSLKQPVRMGR